MVKFQNWGSPLNMSFLLIIVSHQPVHQPVVKKKLPINISFLLILLPWTISTHLLFYSSFLSTTTSLPKRIPFIHAKLKKNANKNTNQACVTGEQSVTQIETLNINNLRNRSFLAQQHCQSLSLCPPTIAQLIQNQTTKPFSFTSRASTKIFVFTCYKNSPCKNEKYNDSTTKPK